MHSIFNINNIIFLNGFIYRSKNKIYIINKIQSNQIIITIRFNIYQ